MPPTLLSLCKKEFVDNNNITWWQKITTHEALINNEQLNPVQLKNLYKQLYTEKWQNTIKDVDGKLFTYSKLKPHFRYENYLCHVKIGQHRAALTKLRTSSHNLNIETGRYTRPKTPKEERLCTTCNVIEDEYHFLICCSRYNDERCHLFQNITHICPNFASLGNSDKFSYLMTAEDEVARETAKFCYLSFEKRKYILYPN